MIDLWQEATRVLPSHSWLTEFRLVETVGKREEQIAILGFSNAAPSLVGIIDGSPLLFDAALTSSIAFDAAEGCRTFRVASQSEVKLAENTRPGCEATDSAPACLQSSVSEGSGPWLIVQSRQQAPSRNKQVRRNELNRPSLPAI